MVDSFSNSASLGGPRPCPGSSAFPQKQLTTAFQKDFSFSYRSSVQCEPSVGSKGALGHPTESLGPRSPFLLWVLRTVELLASLLPCGPGLCCPGILTAAAGLASTAWTAAALGAAKAPGSSLLSLRWCWHADSQHCLLTDLEAVLSSLPCKLPFCVSRQLRLSQWAHICSAVCLWKGTRITAQICKRLPVSFHSGLLTLGNSLSGIPLG